MCHKHTVPLILTEIEQDRHTTSPTQDLYLKPHSIRTRSTKAWSTRLPHPWGSICLCPPTLLPPSYLPKQGPPHLQRHPHFAGHLSDQGL